MCFAAFVEIPLRETGRIRVPLVGAQRSGLVAWVTFKLVTVKFDIPESAGTRLCTLEKAERRLPVAPRVDHFGGESAAPSASRGAEGSRTVVSDGRAGARYLNR